MDIKFLRDDKYNINGQLFKVYNLLDKKCIEQCNIVKV